MPVKPDLCLDVIVRRRYALITDMQEDIEQMFRNAMLYNHPQEPLHRLAAFMLTEASGLAQEFCLQQSGLAGSKFQAEATRVPLLRTQASLVAAPIHVLHHWRTKAEQLVGSRGRVPDPSNPNGPPLRVYCASDRELPPARILASKYWLVVVPLVYFQRPQCNSPLFKIAWKRLFVDEGDNMGGAAITATKLALERLTADHRWIITGTPTSQSGTQSGLANLRRLLGFIGEPPFGDDWGLWEKLIQRPFENNARSDVVLHLQKVRIPAIPTV